MTNILAIVDVPTSPPPGGAGGGCALFSPASYRSPSSSPASSAQLPSYSIFYY